MSIIDTTTAAFGRIKDGLEALKWLPNRALSFAGPLTPRHGAGFVGTITETISIALIIPVLILSGMVDTIVDSLGVMMTLPHLLMGGDWVWEQTDGLTSGPVQDILGQLLPLIYGLLIISALTAIFFGYSKGASAKVKAGTKKLFMAVFAAGLIAATFSASSAGNQQFPSSGYLNKTATEAGAKVTSVIAQTAFSTDAPDSQGIMSCATLRGALYEKFNLELASNPQASTIMTGFSLADENSHLKALSTDVYGETFGPKIDCLSAIYSGNLDPDVVEFIRQTWGIAESGTESGGYNNESNSILTISDAGRKTMAQVGFLACDATSFAAGATNGTVNPAFAGMKAGDTTIDDDQCRQFFARLNLNSAGGAFDVTSDNVAKAINSLPKGNANFRDAAKALKGTVDMNPISYIVTGFVANFARVLNMWPFMWISIGFGVATFMSILIFGLLPLYLLPLVHNYDRYKKPFWTSLLEVVKRGPIALLFMIVYIGFVQFFNDMFMPFALATGLITGAIFVQAAIAFITYRFVKKLFKSIPGLGDPTSIRGTVSAMSTGLPEGARKAVADTLKGGKVGKFVANQVKQTVGSVKNELVRTAVTSKTRGATRGLLGKGKVENPDAPMDWNNDGTTSPHESRLTVATGMSRTPDGSLAVPVGRETAVAKLKKIRDAERRNELPKNKHERDAMIAEREKLEAIPEVRNLANDPQLSTGALELRSSAYDQLVQTTIGVPAENRVYKAAIAEIALADPVNSETVAIAKSAERAAGFSNSEFAEWSQNYLARNPAATQADINTASYTEGLDAIADKLIRANPHMPREAATREAGLTVSAGLFDNQGISAAINVVASDPAVHNATVLETMKHSIREELAAANGRTTTTMTPTEATHHVTETDAQVNATLEAGLRKLTEANLRSKGLEGGNGGKDPIVAAAHKIDREDNRGSRSAGEQALKDAKHGFENARESGPQL